MDYKSIFMLGRLPALGRAELESVLGAAHVQPLGEHAMASDVPLASVVFARLGSAVRMAKPLAVLGTTKWPEIQRYLIEQLPMFIADMPEGKLKLGLSVFGVPVSKQHLFRTGLELKKAAKHAGRTRAWCPARGSS
jgi:hypothetical protein